MSANTAEAQDSTSNVVESTPDEQAVEPGAPKLSEKAKKYWAKVKANPDDFDTWGKLIKELESTGDLSLCREALSSFLADYPLCFGYWKRWASKERKAGNLDKAFELLERGVKATPYSHQLWTHYCDQMKAHRGTDLEAVRSLMVRAADTIGLDYNSEAFWKKYLDFEKDKGDVKRILALYRDIISTPFKKLDEFWLTFQTYATSVPVAALKDVLPAEATTDTQPSNQTQTDTDPTAQTTTDTTEQTEGEGEADQAGKTDKADKTGETEETAATDTPMKADQAPGEEVDSEEDRGAVMKRFERLYSLASRIQKKMSHYEYGIQRPYYHVVQLDAEDLTNWRNYVAWAETQLLPGKDGKALLSMKQVITIYERCMVTCANYPDLWATYASFMEKHDVDAARRIHRQATGIFVKRNPGAFLGFAAFEERHGDSASARRLYQKLLELCPTDLESVLTVASFERRHHGNVCTVYDEALRAMKDNAECACFIRLHYVRYLVTGGLADARQRAEALFEKALASIEATEKPNSALKQTLFIVWMAYINFASNTTGNIEASVTSLYERALSDEAKVSMSSASVSTLWRHYVVFMEDRARELVSIEAVRARFKAKFPTKKPTKKRKNTGKNSEAKRERTEKHSSKEQQDQQQQQQQQQQMDPAAYYQQQQQHYQQQQQQGYGHGQYYQQQW